VLVHSQSGSAAACEIDCEDASYGFSFVNGEGAASGIEDLTIRNARATHGAGILCAGTSSPIIRGCVFIEGNGSVGAGIYCNASSPLIDRCRFERNTASYGGGGARRSDAAPIVSECTFVDNNALRGGAVTSEFASAPLLMNCTLYSNNSAEGSGIFCREYGTVRIENCIIAFGESISARDRLHLTAIHPVPSAGPVIIRYALPADAGKPVRLDVFDVAGRLVRSWPLAGESGGDHRLTWDGYDRNGLQVAAGVYLARLSGGGPVSERTVILVR
jgi:hypothetical protein